MPKYSNPRMTDKITPAQRCALEAVRDGKCFRRYTSKGNSVKGPEGIDGTALWHLEKMHLICETEFNNSIYRSSFVLTDTGRMALREAEEREPRTAAGSLD